MPSTTATPVASRPPAGTLIVTTFTSLAYEELARPSSSRSPAGDGRAGRRRSSNAGCRCIDRLTPEQRKAELGEWLIRSTDGGITWGPRIATVVNSPHGPIPLADGRLLYPGKQLWAAEKKVGVAESLDDGRTWQWLAEIPTRDGDAVADGYHELHGVEVEPGRIVVQIRNHNTANAGETLQTESADGGRTWSEPHPIGVWGLPSHLLRLRDGRLLMTYGHRRAPFGNQARVSARRRQDVGRADRPQRRRHGRRPRLPIDRATRRRPARHRLVRVDEAALGQGGAPPGDVVARRKGVRNRFLI